MKDKRTTSCAINHFLMTKPILLIKNIIIKQLICDKMLNFAAFNYVAGKDSVVRVNGSDFQSCSVPWSAPVLGSGHDTIVLTTYGRRWYISGFANHCKHGQKFVITVLPQQKDAWWSPSPSPSASPSPSPTWAAEAAPPSNAPWAASVPRRSLLQKNLFQIFNRNMVVV
jgi:hypothetical protein